jgi:hypothetical protein
MTLIPGRPGLISGTSRDLWTKKLIILPEKFGQDDLEDIAH